MTPIQQHLRSRFSKSGQTAHAFGIDAALIASQPGPILPWLIVGGIVIAAGFAPFLLIVLAGRKK